MSRLYRNVLIICSLLAGTATAVSAQDVFDIAQSNMAFDQQFDQQLNSMRMQNQASQQQLMQNAIQQFGPQMQAGYQQYVAQYGQNISFEQYAYYWVMSAGGTNAQAGLDGQRRNFEGLQQANATVQQGYDSYNQGYWQNSARMDATMQRYTDGAINGNWYYQHPNGQSYVLPYTTGPGYYQSGNQTFYMNNSGQYYQFDGNGWTELNMLNR